MPRPTLVIGIGGTGSWVLSWLKKDLIETYDTDLSDVPIKLLLLDVAKLIGNVGGMNNATNARVAEQQYSKYITLDPDTEFIRLPTDQNRNTTEFLMDTVEQVKVDPNHAKARDMDHLARWLEPKHFPPAVRDLRDGAGKFRQLGRLSLLQGLHNSANDQVYSMLRQRITEIARPLGDGQPSIDVHIVGSFAGGTGSGLFLDVPMLIRKIAGENISVFTTGFFAMPNVFSDDMPVKIRQKAFNAWRELNRMMTVNEDTAFRIEWGKSRELSYEVERPPYDHVYLLDSAQGGRLLQDKPENFIYPAMAEAISFFIDSRAGERYIQHIRTNLSDEQTRFPFRGRPTYSTFYVKTWKLPEFHYRNIARHKFAVSYMQALLGIEEATALDDAGQTRTVYQLQEANACRPRGLEVFSKQFPMTGQTTFINDLATIARTPRAQIDNLIGRYASPGNNLMTGYAEMPDSDEGQRVNIQISKFKQHRVPNIDITNNRQQNDRQMQQAENRLYGPDHMGGEYLEYYGDFAGNRNRGSLYAELGIVKEFHMDVFQERIRQWLEETLREQGLSCALVALRQMQQSLADIIDFYTEVAERMQDITQTSNIAQREFGRARNANKSANAMQLVAGVHRNAIGKWQQQEARYLTIQRNRRVVQRIIETVTEMHNYVENTALARVTAIAQQLVVDNAVNNVSGVYRTLQNRLRDEQVRHEFDERLEKIMVLLGEEGKTIPDPDAKTIQYYVDRTSWEVDDQMNLRLELRHSEDPNDAPIVLSADISNPKQTEALVTKLVEIFAEAVGSTGQAQRAMDYVLQDAQRFRTELDNSRETLFYGDPTQVKKDMQTFYVRGQASEDQRRQIREMMNSFGYQEQNANRVATIVDSENPNKVVAFSARELLLPENFFEWQRSKDEYLTAIKGDAYGDSDFQAVRNDHLFAAEKNAVELEYRYYRDKQNLGEFPILSHRLVHLMEERTRLIMFLKLWAQGWIVKDREETTGGYTQNWYLEIPGRPRILLMPMNNTDLLTMIARFVTYGVDFYKSALPFDLIGRTLEQHLNRDIYPDQEKAGNLLAIYQYEHDTLKGVAELFRTTVTTDDPAETIKTALGDFFRASQEANEDVHRLTLAEELGFDFTRTTTTGEPLITDSEAHIQAMNIVLPLLYVELLDQVRSIQGERRY